MNENEIMTGLLEILKAIGFAAEKTLEIVYSIAQKVCYFLGHNTISLLTKIDSSCVEKFNQQFSTTESTVSLILGVAELSLLTSILKLVIGRIKDMSYDNSYERYIDNGLSNNFKTKNILGVEDYNLMEAEDFEYHELAKSMFNNNIIDDMNRQMIDNMNSEMMKQCMDEGMKTITPVDEGGYVQGPYLNPSDTFAYETQQNSFYENMEINDFNDSFSDSFDTFDDLDFGFDDGFDSFDDFDCGFDDGFDSFNDFGSGFGEF